MGRPKKIVNPIVYRSFEECYDIILQIIESRRFRWQLTSINWYDFEDVKMHLLAHIHKKWHLFKQEKSLKTWVRTVVNNQMCNLVRNFYGNMKKPCIDCPHYGGENICDKFGRLSTDCDLFRAWVYGKKSKFEIQLPLPMENHSNEVFDIKGNDINVERSSENLHARMKQILKPIEYKIYYNIYVLHKSDSEVAKLMGYTSNEKDRPKGYKQLNRIKKALLLKAREILNNGEIDIV